MPNHDFPPCYRSEAGYRAVMDWYDRAWARLCVPAERLCLPTRYGMTHVVAAGREDAPPLLLLHGINTCAATWIPQIDGLADAFRVYAPDVPGFAGRSAATRLRYDDASFAAWGIDLLNALGIEQVALVGGSAGGQFALRL